jgi:hypothetical protein
MVIEIALIGRKRTFPMLTPMATPIFHDVFRF